ncbi:MAG: SGNH/GDSL hydrolase family protein [bacterium]
MFAWNLYAKQFSGFAVGARIRGHVIQDASRNDDVPRTLSELPPLGRPLIAVFGSSQVDAVKDDPELSPRAFPFRMSETLATLRPDHVVIDLSGPGQQVVEANAILLSSLERLKPSLVVLTVGLVSMSTTDIRPALQSGLDRPQIEKEIDAVSDSMLPPSTRTIALASVQPNGKSASDTTVQERTDAYLEQRFRAATAMIANRRAMYNALIDQPLRRDLVRLLQRRRGPLVTARTFDISDRYAVSLAAIETMGAVLANRGTPFVICVLPYERSRTPPPYTPETNARVARDLRDLSARHGFTVLDLSEALTTSDFGVYEDGSPDGLHFRANGHALVGAELAKTVSAILTTRPGIAPASTPVTNPR